jgi:hypothetical protein
MTAPKYVRTTALVLVLLSIGAVSLWFTRMRAPDSAAPEAPPSTAEERPSPLATPPEPGPLPGDRDTAPTASGEDRHQPGDPSHPITDEHRRLYRENNFIHTIDNAIMVKDYAAVRRMNAEYKNEFPKDEFVVQEAYEMIADCLEQKTPERVARARAFWEKRRSSRARRDLRHICLE